MDRLIAEVETKTEEKIETEVQVDEAVQESEIAVTEESEISEQAQTENSKYLSSFENMTLADFKKKEEEKKLQEFQQEKEVLIQKQYEEKPEEKPQPKKEEKQEVSQKIIEKPNYDLLQENTKIVKLTKNEKPKKKMSKKKLSLFLSLALGISAVICLTNVIIIDHMSANLSNIEYEYYDVNLPRYLKNIADLDSAKKGMEFVETYPEDILDAGQAGEQTNWFDKLCNFFSGLFGG